MRACRAWRGAVVALASLFPALAHAAPAKRPPPPDVPALPDISDRVAWREVGAGFADIPETVADTLAGWFDLIQQLSPNGVAFFGTAAIGLAVLAMWRYVGEPRLYARATRAWAAHPVSASLPGLITVIVTSVLAATWLSVLGQMVSLDAPSPVQRAQVALLVAVLTLATIVAVLGRATLRLLATPSRPVVDAASLRAVAPWLGGLLVAVAFIERGGVFRLNALGEPAPAAHLLVALVFCAIASLVLLRLAASLQDTQDGWGNGERRTVHALRLLLALGWILVSVVIGALVLGYVALASFLAKQGLWSVVVLALLHLIWRVVRDASDLLLARRGLMERWSRRLGVGQRRLQQVVILSGGLVVFLAAGMAIVLLSAPYGVGPADLLGRVIDRGGRLTIGSLVISPGQLVRALLVFAAVAVIARVIARWLANRLLPTTRLDAGVQSSLTSIIGYIGVIIGVAMALAALGIGMDRITWVVSALTVGIGFGLQAIVQNFISGLILLAERPVKVGDWVVVGDAEGDVRRINVRATEIALPDRTTVLVPNSELITKVVRNRTFAAGDGLVKILLPLPATTDVENVVRIIHDVVNSHRELKSTPPPLVQVEEVKDNKVWLGVSGSVDGPRQVTRIRAELLFQLLQRLQREGIALV